MAVSLHLQQWCGTQMAKDASFYMDCSHLIVFLQLLIALRLGLLLVVLPIVWKRDKGLGVHHYLALAGCHSPLPPSYLCTLLAC